jgi:hypothetical protein
MPRRKFSDFELGEAIRAGKDVKVMAAEFGVSVQSIYKRAKRLKLNISRDTAFHQAAAINEQQIRWSEQFLKINESGNRWLSNLELLIVSKQKDQIDSIVAELNMLIPELSEESKEVIFLPAVERLQKMVIYDLEVLDRLPKFIAEIRQQLKLLMDAWKQKYDTEQIAHAQRVIVEEIRKESPALAGRITERIKAVMAIECVGWNLTPG